MIDNNVKSKKRKRDDKTNETIIPDGDKNNENNNTNKRKKNKKNDKCKDTIKEIIKLLDIIIENNDGKKLLKQLKKKYKIFNGKHEINLEDSFCQIMDENGEYIADTDEEDNNEEFSTDEYDKYFISNEEEIEEDEEKIEEPEDGESIGSSSSEISEEEEELEEEDNSFIVPDDYVEYLSDREISNSSCDDNVHEKNENNIEYMGDGEMLNSNHDNNSYEENKNLPDIINNSILSDELILNDSTRDEEMENIHNDDDGNPIEKKLNNCLNRNSQEEVDNETDKSLISEDSIF